MKPIGGDRSELLSMSAAEFTTLQDRIRDGQLPEPHAIFPDGPTGALVRFRTLDDAMMAKLAVV